MASEEISQETALDSPIDKEIMIIVKVEIGVGWVDLAGRLLPDHVIDEIKQDHHSYGIKEQAYQALRKWRQREPEIATIRLLVKHLEEMGRRDLAIKVREVAISNSRYITNHLNSVVSYLEITNKAKEEWKSLAILLLSPEEVERIEKECVQYGRSDMLYQCILCWQSKQARPPSIVNFMDFLASKGKTDAFENIITSISEAPMTHGIATSKASRYDMNYEKRGRVLIFEHQFFQDATLSTRYGSKKDTEGLHETFVHLGFMQEDILIFRDLRARQIQDTLKKVSMEDHTNHGCLVVAIMSSGESGFVNAFDHKMAISKLWAPFHSRKCSTLTAKPKVFFIQVCRGDSILQNVDDFVTSSDESTGYYPDLLVAYATLPGYASFRNMVTGSWFILELCRQLTTHGHNKDVVSILGEVSKEVSKREASPIGGRQMPAYTNFLRKQLVFTSESIDPK